MNIEWIADYIITESIINITMPIFKLLKIKSFNIYLGANGINEIGFMCRLTAIGWLSYELSDSPLFVGTLAAANGVSMSLLSFFGGILADRYSKPKIILTKTPDILDSIAKRKVNRPKLVIGFAAETNDLILNAQKKLKEKECDWIVANDVLKNPDVFGGENNKITLITKNKIEKWKKTNKNNIANKLTNKIEEFFNK